MNADTEKISLREIDKENWRFVLYESEKGDWYGCFVYSPQSFADLSMLVKLSPKEQTKARENRDYPIYWNWQKTYVTISKTIVIVH